MNVILLGDVVSGKTSMLVHNENWDASDISRDYITRKINGKQVKLWNTTGMEKSGEILGHYITQANIAIIVYNPYDKRSFEYALDCHSTLAIKKILVANFLCKRTNLPLHTPSGATEFHEESKLVDVVRMLL